MQAIENQLQNTSKTSRRKMKGQIVSRSPMINIMARKRKLSNPCSPNLHARSKKTTLKSPSLHDLSPAPTIGSPHAPAIGTPPPASNASPTNTTNGRF
jgi:hypothetical protein